jgi:hypothetical protein
LASSVSSVNQHGIRKPDSGAWFRGDVLGMRLSPNYNPKTRAT